jgi:hypothetical protein
MNLALSQLADEIGLDDPRHDALRHAFAYACVERVRHLLEDPRAIACLDVLDDYVQGRADAAQLAAAAQEAAGVARSHRGSNSLDGSAHAAVSATHAVARAVAGRALEAASYAAYASVYAYGGYAVKDPATFEPEYEWQVRQLRRLARV